MLRCMLCQVTTLIAISVGALKPMYSTTPGLRAYGSGNDTMYHTSFDRPRQPSILARPFDNNRTWPRVAVLSRGPEVTIPRFEVLPRKESRFEVLGAERQPRTRHLKVPPSGLRGAEFVVAFARSNGPTEQATCTVNYLPCLGYTVVHDFTLALISHRPQLPRCMMRSRRADTFCHRLRISLSSDPALSSRRSLLLTEVRCLF